MKGGRVLACAAMLLAVLPARGGDLRTMRLSSSGPDPDITAAAIHGPRIPIEGDGPSGLTRPSVSADGALVVFDSAATNLDPPVPGGLPLLTDVNGVADLFLHDVRIRMTRRLPITRAGTLPNGASRHPAISGDGRYVAFESDASNLVSGDTNGVTDVFIHDIVAGITQIVSHANGQAANGPSTRPSITHDGGTIAFESRASNLAGNDTNGASDVFVKVRGAPGSVLVSRSKSGASGAGASNSATIAPNGAAIAYASGAPDIVLGDTNGARDVFVHSPPIGGMARLVSAGPFGQGDRDSGAPSLAGYPTIAFESDATNLDANDHNGQTDVFLRASLMDPPVLVSRSAAGSASGRSHSPSGSAYGAIAFVSTATDLGGGSAGVVEEHVYLADPITGEVELVTGADGVVADGPSGAPSISADGLLVTYASDASNLVSDDANGVRDVFARVDERRCANGAEEEGPVSREVHQNEAYLGRAEPLGHAVSCTLAGAGL